MDSPFETQCHEYDAWFDEQANVYRSELLAIRAVLPDPGVWVEIGVGSGRFASELGVSLGIEPADGMAALARKRGVEVLKGTAEALPLSDESADAAFLITTLCFLADMDRAFQETRRVLRPGGSVIVAFIPKNSRFGTLYEESAASDPFYKHARFYTTSEVLLALTRAGLNVDRTVQTLTGSPADADEAPESPAAGVERGSFVVVRARLPGREPPRPGVPAEPSSAREASDVDPLADGQDSGEFACDPVDKKVNGPCCRAIVCTGSRIVYRNDEFASRCCTR